MPFNSWGGVWNNSTKTWGSFTGNTSANHVANNKLLSVAGYYPTHTRTRGEIRANAINTGEKYYQYSFWDNFVVQLLMLVEMGSFKSQNIIGAGITNLFDTKWSSYNNMRPNRKTGDTVVAGNQTIAMNNATFEYNIAGTDYSIESLSYRGIENPYGHIWKWVDSVNLRWFEDGDARYAQAFLSENPRTHVDWSNNLNPDVSGFVKLPARIYTHMNSSGTHGYLKNVSKEFLPATGHSNSGTRNNYVDDYFFVPGYDGLAGQNRVMAVSGASANSALAGAWGYRSTNGSGDRITAIGGRLCCFGE